MSQDLSQLLEDWLFIRKNTLEFLEALTEEELVKRMPRPGIDTFMKHFEEMCDVQRAYLDACITREMSFECVKENDEYEGTTSKKEMIRRMQEQDDRIEMIIENYSTTEIKWEDDDVKTLNSQLRNLCIHEALHLGQLIAFAYTMGINIPEYVVDGWALS